MGGMRAGSADDMAASRMCNMESCIIHGGWSLDKICKYFWYLKKSDQINNAGRANNGFHDGHLKVFSRSLDFIRNKREEQLAFKYGISLFSGAGIEQLNHPSLNIYKKLMIAYLLENFDNVLQDRKYTRTVNVQKC